MTIKPPEAIPEVPFDASSPAFRFDPYPFYRRLRDQAPIARASDDFVLVARYRDCEQVLGEARWHHPAKLACASQGEGADYDNSNFGGLRNLFEDPDTPEAGAGQVKMRRVLITRAFSRKGANQVEPMLTKPVNRLIDEVLEAGEVDFVTAFSEPLVFAMACDLLGVPAADRPAFQQWVRALGAAIDPFYVQSAEETKRLTQVGQEFRRYMTDLVAEHRRRPTDDLISTLVAVQDDADQLSDAELVTTCCILTMATSETTINFLSMALWSLLRNPDQIALFQANPQIARRAIDELLRYDTQIQFLTRVAAEDSELGGFRIPAGQYVFTLVASANRDAEVFSKPERLDLTRKHNPHMAFGAGRHFCIGAPFARMETQFALSTLMARISGFALAGEPEVMQRFNNRGLAHLPVSFRAGTAS